MIGIPSGYTEEDILAIVNKICNGLASKWKFGFHELDDIKQQIFLEILTPDGKGKNALQKFNPEKGDSLDSFLWVHASNRLYNFKRNNYARPNKPCESCPLNAFINKKCTAYERLSECEYYYKWETRNRLKKGLMSTNPSSNEMYDRHETSLEDKILSREIYNLVDSNMPIALREDWLRYTNKLKLSKNKRESLLETILNILKENGIDTDVK